MNSWKILLISIYFSESSEDESSLEPPRKRVRNLDGTGKITNTQFILENGKYYL